VALIDVFLTAIGGTLVVLLIAAYLGRRFMDIQVGRAIKKYEAELNQKAEVLKTELSIYAHEQNIGLTRIDAQRSEAILALWEVLGEWHEIFLELTAPNDRLEKDAARAIQKYQEWARQLMGLSGRLSVEVRNQAIFFDPPTYEAIARCGIAVTDVTNNFYAETFEAVDPSASPNATIFLNCVSQAREKLGDSAKVRVNELRSALVHEFRVLMSAEKQ
jgi:hypothetical protein